MHNIGDNKIVGGLIQGLKQIKEVSKAFIKDVKMMMHPDKATTKNQLDESHQRQENLSRQENVSKQREILSDQYREKHQPTLPKSSDSPSNISKPSTTPEDKQVKKERRQGLDYDKTKLDGALGREAAREAQKASPQSQPSPSSKPSSTTPDDKQMKKERRQGLDYDPAKLAGALGREEKRAYAPIEKDVAFDTNLPAGYKTLENREPLSPEQERNIRESVDFSTETEKPSQKGKEVDFDTNLPAGYKTLENREPLSPEQEKNIRESVDFSTKTKEKETDKPSKNAEETIDDILSKGFDQFEAKSKKTTPESKDLF